MDVSPERAPEKGAEAGGRHVHAPAEIESDESAVMRAHLKDDLPDIVLAEVSAGHGFSYCFGHEVGGGRAAGLEITRKAARALTRLEEHEFEEARIFKPVIHINLQHLHHPLLIA